MGTGHSVQSRYWLLWVLLSGLCWTGFFLVWLWIPYRFFGWWGVLVAVPLPFACVGFVSAGLISFDKRSYWVEDSEATTTTSKGRWTMSVHPHILTARGGYVFCVQLLFLAISMMVGPGGPGVGNLDSALFFSSMGAAALLPALYNEQAKRILLWTSSVLFALGVLATGFGIVMYGVPTLWRG